MIIINGETAEITVRGVNALTVSGNVVNVEVTGATGPTGAPATERKFSLWRVRQDNDLVDCEFEELFNNTAKGVDFTAIASGNIDIVSEIFSSPFTVTWNGGQLREPGYLLSNEFYVLTNPAYIFTGGSNVSDWSYVIIEDLENLL